MLRRRLVPEIAKAFQFQASHVERHIISRYTAEEEGHFRAHRDNNAVGTAYRRFAATINLNEDFEGGTLIFRNSDRKISRRRPAERWCFPARCCMKWR